MGETPFQYKNPSCYSIGTAKELMKGGIDIPNNDFIIASFNVKHDDIESFYTKREENTFYHHITLKIKVFDCPYCGGKVISHGKKLKIIHHPTLRDFDGVIYYRARRYLCKECSKTFFERNPFSFENFNNSIVVIDRIMKLLKSLDLSFKRIAELTEVSTTTVINYLDSFVSLPKPFLPESMGIDEIHEPELAHRGSAYLCIIVDNEKRRPVDVLESRSKSYMNKHFERYTKTDRDKVKYVTIDMWEPYKDVAKKNFKNAKIAVDPFHVVKTVCLIFTNIRVSIMKKSPEGSDTYYLLKKWHKLLDTNDINLDNKAEYNSHFKRRLNKRQLYEMLLDTSEKLRDAYYLKNSYQLFNSNATYENCEVWLDKLIDDFSTTYITEYHPFANTLIN